MCLMKTKGFAYDNVYVEINVQNYRRLKYYCPSMSVSINIMVKLLVRVIYICKNSIVNNISILPVPDFCSSKF